MSARIVTAALLFLATSLGATGCRRQVRPAPPQSSALEHGKLLKLSDEYWDFLMEENPVWATYLGDRRFDRALPDLSVEARERALETNVRFKEDLETIDPDELSETDRITRDALLEYVGALVETAVCKEPLWNVNALDGAQTTLGELPQLHAVRTREEAEALEVRYLKSAVYIDQHLANLQLGAERGYLAAKPAVARVLSQLSELTAEKPEASSFISAVQLPEGWRDDDRAEVRKKLTDAVRSALYPALVRYREYLAGPYSLLSREALGVTENPGGQDCYEARARMFTGSALGADEVHQLGLEELERNEAGMKEVALQVVGEPDIAKLEAKLLGDPLQHPKTREELIAFNQQLVDRASKAMPAVFGRLPTRKVELRAVEPFREKDSPSGFYYEAPSDGSRPAYYYVNTFNPEGRSLFQMEALAFHEALPGHHLQIAVAQELAGLPRFRKEIGQTAFVEGWAHYAELLADELSLYTSPASRYGMYSDQALRAVRLVVDTGLHTKGWTREQAIQFMVDHTAEPPDECAREVDRYVVWPAQALAYKLGQLEFLKLRQEARDELGSRFDLKAFHDQALKHGAVPMPVLRRLLTAWVEETKARLPATTTARETR